ncbi:hypothetical protein JOS77_16575 [Chromobacterium haemolyticum]|nr:hypothetical protein JOS77_16575 [Chromobacterium haemolyticum]
MATHPAHGQVEPASIVQTQSVGRDSRQLGSVQIGRTGRAAGGQRRGRTIGGHRGRRLASGRRGLGHGAAAQRFRLRSGAFVSGRAGAQRRRRPRALAAADQRAFALDEARISPAFLECYRQSEGWRFCLERLGAAVEGAEFGFEALAEIPLPVPPLSEQRKLVEEWARQDEALLARPAAAPAAMAGATRRAVGALPV